MTTHESVTVTVDRDGRSILARSGPVTAAYQPGQTGYPEVLIEAGGELHAFDGESVQNLAAALESLARLVRESPTREYVDDRGLYGDETGR